MNELNNNNDINDLLDVLKTLYDKIFEELHVATLAFYDSTYQAYTATNGYSIIKCKMTPYADEEYDIYAYSIGNNEFSSGQLVPIIFTDLDFRKAINSAQPIKCTNKKRHNLKYAIVISGSGGGGSLEAYATKAWVEAKGYLEKSNIVNNVTSTDTDKALSANMGKELQDEIDNLKAPGRYLSEWNCSSGLPLTNPPSLPYTYERGDWFVVGTVTSAGGTNYKPSGTVYTGSASTTVETETVVEGDYYKFDGTTWILVTSGQKTTSFKNIAGDPYTNTNLANAFNNKVSKSGDNMTGSLLFSDNCHIQVGSLNGGNSLKQYVSAGAGYSKNAGKYGIKIICCDQGDCQTGLGQDLNAEISGGYDLAIAGGTNSSGYGSISFVVHPVNSTAYTTLGEFVRTSTSTTFNVRGTILQNSVAVALSTDLESYLPLSGGTLTGELSTKKLYVKDEGIEIYDDTSPYIDFHYANSTDDYTARIINLSGNIINIIASGGVKANGTLIATTADLLNYVPTSSVSTTAVANTVVQRDDNGYIYANFFNASGTIFQDTLDVYGFYYQGYLQNDTFIRKCSVNRAKEVLGVVTISGTNDGTNWLTLTIGSNTFNIPQDTTYTNGTGLLLSGTTFSVDTNTIATRDFVNSSIATNTAYFLGTLDANDDLGLTKPASHSDIVTALNSYSFSQTKTNNDYVFVINLDSANNTLYERFKWNSSTTTFAYEYSLNNSSFTAAQWSAINSGITAAKVTSYDSHIVNTSNPHSVTAAQVGLGDVVNTGDSATPVWKGTTKFTTGGAYTELAKKLYSNGSTNNTTATIPIYSSVAAAITIKRTNSAGGAFIDYGANNSLSTYWRVGMFSDNTWGACLTGNQANSIAINTSRQIIKDNTYTYTLPDANGTIMLGTKWSTNGSTDTYLSYAETNVTGSDLQFLPAIVGNSSLNGLGYTSLETLFTNSSYNFFANKEVPTALTPSACTKNGFYYVSSSDTTGDNANPFYSLHTSNLDFKILVNAYNNSWLQQIATDFRSSDVYIRRKQNGTWTSWYKLAYSNEIPDNFVTTDSYQTISKPKVIRGLDSDDGTAQPALLKVLSTESAAVGTAAWKGRIMCGAENKTFLMGTYNGICGLGAHSWTSAVAGTGAAWEPIYLNPDGTAAVYIGGSGWTANSGWMKVDNSTGKCYVNRNTVASASWQEIATTNDLSSYLLISNLPYTSTIQASNEFDFIPNGFNSTVYFNYKACDQTSATVAAYRFCNGNTGLAPVYASAFYVDTSLVATQSWVEDKIAEYNTATFTASSGTLTRVGSNTFKLASASNGTTITITCKKGTTIMLMYVASSNLYFTINSGAYIHPDVSGASSNNLRGVQYNSIIATSTTVKLTYYAAAATYSFIMALF